MGGTTGARRATGPAVAVLGAGFQGVCTALELARRGARVELIERHPRPLEGPGGFNEGKIHLGFVYAHDPSRATARLMIRGALAFQRLLARWIDPRRAGEPSEPFTYAVHRESMLSPAAVREHVAAVGSLLREEIAEGADYLGSRPAEPWRELEPTELRARFDPERVAAAFETCERSVDPVRIAELLRGALAAADRVHFSPGVTILGVRPAGERFAVRVERGRDVAERTYDHVVNALWDGRLAVDASAGIEAERPWLHRCKYGIRVAAGGSRPSYGSVTVVLGAFGDVVSFGDGRRYLSWYPVCRTAATSALAPPAWPLSPPPAEAAALFAETRAALSRVVPAVAALEPHDVEVRGGAIVAWGRSDIADPGSGLHERWRVGPRSRGSYHSVDTGKYSLAPLFAMEVADRILTG